jgi:hypothetical protein
VKPFIALVLLIALANFPAKATDIRVDGIAIDVRSFNVAPTKSVGGNDRGPALAVLSDGSILLGGGARGGSIYSWRESDKKLKLLGQMMSKSERIRDSRFAITDIAVLSENVEFANLLISFPRLRPSGCVELVVFRATYDRMKKSVIKNDRWFSSKPCVPVSAVQHAAGRMEVINNKSAFLTVGDLGFTNVNNRSKRGNLGSVFRITKSKVTLISEGHRNQQGIVLMKGGDLLTSEHGPRGGDEINLVERGVDYGWPFVTYGAPYSEGDYVIPEKTGTHVGFREPLKHWTPSIAPTELVQVPNGRFGKYSGGVAMGTLRETSLVFMRYQGGRIRDIETVNVGTRIRDLEVLREQRLIASTDDGRLLIFKSPANS